MDGLIPLETCLARALTGLQPVAPEMLAPGAACGHPLAADVVVPQDLPAAPQALRAGLAVSALDLVGASAQIPVPLDRMVRVLPGMALPAGADAVLPEDDAEDGAAIRPVMPGEGVRRLGHDGRAGALLLPAGRLLSARDVLAAELAGLALLPVRRPRVRIDLPDAAMARFAAGWARAAGARVVEGDDTHLCLRVTGDHRPRLALMPGDTGFLAPEGGTLVLTLPARFDGMVAALMALGLPALAALGGAAPRAEALPLARKLTSTVGLADLVLLARDGNAWSPAPAGLITVTGLASADAFAIIPPDSEGAAPGEMLAATPIDMPFG